MATRHAAHATHVKAQVGGKLAQIGSRLIDGAAAKIADDFFARFSERLAPATAERRGRRDRRVRRGRAPRSRNRVDSLRVARRDRGDLATSAMRGIR